MAKKSKEVAPTVIDCTPVELKPNPCANCKKLEQKIKDMQKPKKELSKEEQEKKDEQKLQARQKRNDEKQTIEELKKLNVELQKRLLKIDTSYDSDLSTH